MTSNIEALTYPVISALVRSLSLAVAISIFPSPVIAQKTDSSPLQLERKIPLGKVAGRIDHMAFDPTHHRLFVAELGNNTVGVVDLDAQKVIHRISGLTEPQGVAYISKNDTLYVANGGDGSVQFFREPSYSPLGRINLGADADNIRVDLATNRLLVGYGSGAIATIDLDSNKKAEAFALAAHPESFQLDAATRQIFVNLPKQRSIAVVDADTGKQRAWSLAYGGNFPMALDSERQRVLVVFRNPARFAAFNWQTGEPVFETETCGDADDLFADTQRKRIYIICGAGFIDVLRSDDPKYPRLSRIPTIAGARTGLFVTEEDRLFVAARAQSREPASIWVYRLTP